MKKKHLFLLVVITSFCFSVLLGWLDYETTSFSDIFFGDAGNILALVIYTTIFSAIAFACIGFSKLIHSI